MLTVNYGEGVHTWHFLHMFTPCKCSDLMEEEVAGQHNHVHCPFWGVIQCTDGLPAQGFYSNKLTMYLFCSVFFLGLESTWSDARNLVSWPDTLILLCIQLTSTEKYYSPLPNFALHGLLTSLFANISLCPHSVWHRKKVTSCFWWNNEQIIFDVIIKCIFKEPQNSLLGSPFLGLPSRGWEIPGDLRISLKESSIWGERLQQYLMP